MIETNVKTFFEKRNCYSGYSGYFEIKYAFVSKSSNKRAGISKIKA